MVCFLIEAIKIKIAYLHSKSKRKLYFKLKNKIQLIEIAALQMYK